MSETILGMTAAKRAAENTDGNMTISAPMVIEMIDRIAELEAEQDETLAELDAKIALIVSMEAELKSREWIRCADKLPEMGFPVLADPCKGDELQIVYRINGDPSWCWVNLITGNYYAQNDPWFQCWQPLPSPPESDNAK